MAKPEFKGELPEVDLRVVGEATTFGPTRIDLYIKRTSNFNLIPPREPAVPRIINDYETWG